MLTRGARKRCSRELTRGAHTGCSQEAHKRCSQGRKLATFWRKVACQRIVIIELRGHFRNLESHSYKRKAVSFFVCPCLRSTMNVVLQFFFFPSGREGGLFGVETLFAFLLFHMGLKSFRVLSYVKKQFDCKAFAMFHFFFVNFVWLSSCCDVCSVVCVWLLFFCFHCF